MKENEKNKIILEYAIRFGLSIALNVKKTKHSPNIQINGRYCLLII
jgi:hypothetical protein